jgi:hypothetical protein
MGSSKTRQALRLQLGANRKSIGIRWMNGWTVEVRLSKMKADKGAERSFLDTRKTRRGQRRGKKRVRGGKPLHPTRRPSKGPDRSARVINHAGRKVIWFERTSAKMARLPSYLRLENRAAPYFNGEQWLDSALSGSPEWRVFGSVFSPFKRRVKAIGQRLYDQDKDWRNWSYTVNSARDLWTFLQTRSRRAGDFGFLMEAGLSHLPRKVPEVVFSPGSSKVPVFSETGKRACRVCGYLGLGPHAWNNCRPKSGSSRSGVNSSARTNRRTRGAGRG